jgi:hypothetical protein
VRAPILLAFFVGQLLASAQDWGPPVNGLRIALAVDNEHVVVTLNNVREDREMFLPLGRTVGIGRAEFLHLELISPDGSRRHLEYTGGSGLAPGRLLPYIVPMMHGSTYSLKTPLRYWRVGAGLRRIDADLARGASLQASLAAAESLQWQYVDCYGLRMFWSGRAVSNIFTPTKARQ